MRGIVQHPSAIVCGPTPALDEYRTAQTVAVRTVHAALAGHAGVTDHHGQWVIDGPVRPQARPGQMDRLVTYTLAADDGRRVAVTLMVATTPLPAGGTS